MCGQMIWYQKKCGAKDHISKESKCPIPRIGKMEENMVGKDAWKWKDCTKASVWRRRRNLLFQSMYEHFGIVPLIVITSVGMKGE